MYNDRLIVSNNYDFNPTELNPVRVNPAVKMAHDGYQSLTSFACSWKIIIVMAVIIALIAIVCAFVVKFS